MCVQLTLFKYDSFYWPLKWVFIWTLVYLIFSIFMHSCDKYSKTSSANNRITHMMQMYSILIYILLQFCLLIRSFVRSLVLPFDLNVRSFDLFFRRTFHPSLCCIHNEHTYVCVCTITYICTHLYTEYKRVYTYRNMCEIHIKLLFITFTIRTHGGCCHVIFLHACTNTPTRKHNRSKTSYFAMSTQTFHTYLYVHTHTHILARAHTAL